MKGICESITLVKELISYDACDCFFETMYSRLPAITISKIIAIMKGTLASGGRMDDAINKPNPSFLNDAKRAKGMTIPRSFFFFSPITNTIRAVPMVRIMITAVKRASR